MNTFWNTFWMRDRAFKIVHCAIRCYKKKALRGPKKILPTKTTNLVSVVSNARNGLAIGHRRRNSRVGEVI